MDQFLSSVHYDCLWSEEDSIYWENVVWIISKYANNEVKIKNSSYQVSNFPSLNSLHLIEVESYNYLFS